MEERLWVICIETYLFIRLKKCLESPHSPKPISLPAISIRASRQFLHNSASSSKQGLSAYNLYSFRYSHGVRFGIITLAPMANAFSLPAGSIACKAVAAAMFMSGMSKRRAAIIFSVRSKRYSRVSNPIRCAKSGVSSCST